MPLDCATRPRTTAAAPHRPAGPRAVPRAPRRARTSGPAVVISEPNAQYGPSRGSRANIKPPRATVDPSATRARMSQLQVKSELRGFGDKTSWEIGGMTRRLHEGFYFKLKNGSGRGPTRPRTRR